MIFSLCVYCYIVRNIISCTKVSHLFARREIIIIIISEIEEWSFIFHSFTAFPSSGWRERTMLLLVDSYIFKLYFFLNKLRSKIFEIKMEIKVFRLRKSWDFFPFKLNWLTRALETLLKLQTMVFVRNFPQTIIMPWILLINNSTKLLN